MLLAAVVFVGAVYGIAEWRRRAFNSAWARLTPGMSREEVRRLIGAPDSEYGSALKQPTITSALFVSFVIDARYERWAYGHRRLLKTNSEFPWIVLALDGLLGPENDDYVVYFSDDGLLMRTAHPNRTPKSSGTP